MTFVAIGALRVKHVVIQFLKRANKLKFTCFSSKQILVIQFINSKELLENLVIKVINSKR